MHAQPTPTVSLSAPLSPSPSPCHVRTSQEVAICKPGREPSPDPNHDGTLILDFQPPELWENKLLFKPPRLWCFVMVAWAD